jgi:hypothetical protein
MKYLLVLVAACSSSHSDGGDISVDAAPACSTGTIDGTITTDTVIHTFGPIVRAFETHDPDDNSPVLVIDEQPSPDGGCSTVAATGFNLAFVFQAEPTPGVYTANTSVLGVAEQDGDANLALSTAGTATIDGVTDACFTGHYSLTFANRTMMQGSLDGTFAVARCP